MSKRHGRRPPIIDKVCDWILLNGVIAAITAFVVLVALFLAVKGWIPNHGHFGNRL